MNEFDIYVKKLGENKLYLQEHYGVSDLGIFGSYTRGEQNKKSDIDVLVDFDEPISLLRFIDLERHLCNLLGRKVDLVMRSALKPRIGKRILKEVIYI